MQKIKSDEKGWDSQDSIIKVNKEMVSKHGTNMSDYLGSLLVVGNKEKSHAFSKGLK